MTLSDIRADLQMKRDPQCDLTGEWLRWSELELHHIFGRDGGSPLMDDPRNLVFIKRTLHKPGTLGYHNQCQLAWVQEGRYGKRAMEEWRDSLGWKIPIRLPWEGKR